MLIIIICLSIFSCRQHTDADYQNSKKKMFDQSFPEENLEIFAPEIVSTGLNEGTITISPNGNECFWSILFSGYETIVTSKIKNGKWTKPEVASFSGKYYDGWPAIHPDGKRLFFHSARPVTDTSEGITAQFNIWYVDRINDSWSEPKLVNSPVNSNENSTCPSVSMNGALYLSKKFSDDTEKLCRSELKNGVYQDLEVLPDNINVLKENFHCYISPDESYLIRICYGRPDNVGAGWNYYITFRKSDGTWSDLVNMGKEVNSVYCGGGASVSADGKYIFFQGIPAAKLTDSLDRIYTLEELVERDVKRPSLGSIDIYWINANIIAGLKSKK